MVQQIQGQVVLQFARRDIVSPQCLESSLVAVRQQSFSQLRQNQSILAIRQ